jgi:hypothetical protein
MRTYDHQKATEIISRVNKSLPMNSLITIVLTDILRVITNKIRQNMIL